MDKIILEFEKPIIEFEKKIDELRKLASMLHTDLSAEISSLEKRLLDEKKAVYSSFTSWQRVLISMKSQRPQSSQYINSLMRNKVELFGDRIFGNDPAIIGGLAKFRGYDVLFLGQERGLDTKERLARNFGLMHPDGYRKALRLMKLAEKFSKPVVTFIDTQGAHPGIEAEERGQAFAIAENLAEMSALTVPIISVVIGQGGSGGALGIGVADRILMLENAIYSVCLPETCSQILWRDNNHAPEAAEALKLTAYELQKLGIVDQVIKEPLGGAHADPGLIIHRVGRALKRNLDTLSAMSIDELLVKRYQKYRSIGQVSEKT